MNKDKIIDEKWPLLFGLLEEISNTILLYKKFVGLSFSLSRVTWSVQWGALRTLSVRVSRDISVSSYMFTPYCRLHHVWWKLLCRRRNCARNRGLCRFFNTNYQLLYTSSIMIILEQESSQIYKIWLKDFLYHYMYSHSNEFPFYQPESIIKHQK